uniref:ATP synthase epsilon chain,ATP synthase epsilon chain, chloroplastic n=1 Tax=Thermosynechococcus vestitus (strain NIES-2133 / IAM M-273 / BP-1) TaxID=197221 RepID=UPI0001C2FA5F|nr:Chain A, ATP synthase epsilon chain,ATP synthase epsilon chain, chloroplastic [Thermosynechococcus vestitus BP-1]
MVMTVRVIAPDKTVWDAPAEEVILPSTTGQLGILSNHAPLLTALETGVMRVRQDREWVAIALMGGFAEVENNEVTILVNGAERGDTIDPQEAQQTLEIAEANLRKAEGARQKIEANLALRRARTRVEASNTISS